MRILPTGQLREMMRYKNSNTGERILVAALDLFHQKGFYAVSVSDICRAADVKKGSFYHFYSSKTVLFLEVIKHKYSEMLTLYDQACNESIDPGGKIKRMFDLVADYHDSFPKVYGCPLANFLRESLNEDVIIREIKSSFTILENRLADIVEEINKSEVYGELDVKQTARNIFAFLKGAVLMAQVENDTDCIREKGGIALQLCTKKNPECNG